MSELIKKNKKETFSGWYNIKYFFYFFLLLFFSDIYAQNNYITPDGNGDITFTPGFRIQTRYEYNQIDKNNDIFIRRVRLKGNGNLFRLASYAFEFKIDNTGRFNSKPTAQVENAWLNFPIIPDLDIRVGLYDMVFSRNALTSDSKLLLMDRSLIKNALTVLGVTDNTVGILAHGRPLDGHLSYGFGIFDNLGFEVAGDSTTIARKSDGIMTTGRLVYDFLDTPSPGGYGDYKGSYIGEGERFSIGINVAYVSEAQIGNDAFSLFAWGSDIFFNAGKATFEAEYDSYIEDMSGNNNPNIKGAGWYVQGGYLFHKLFEPVARYQEIDPDNNVRNDKQKWTSIGFNAYLKGHNLKIQTEYIFKSETENEISNDLIQIQLQLDF